MFKLGKKTIFCGCWEKSRKNLKLGTFSNITVLNTPDQNALKLI